MQASFSQQKEKEKKREEGAGGLRKRNEVMSVNFVSDGHDRVAQCAFEKPSTLSRVKGLV